MALIEVKHMSFGYTKDMILEDVNMTVDEHEYVGIIGANGAGKSTLMKLILGELTPVSGEILLDGRQMLPRVWEMIVFETIPCLDMCHRWDFRE